MSGLQVPVFGGAPVAVIGNGPVGQTTALLLARWGIPVLLLDGRTQRDAVGSKAICQQRDVLDIWSALGAGRIADDGVTWTTARTFYRGDELFSWSFVDRGHSPLPAFVNVSQCHSEQVLDQQIATNPLIEVRWGHVVCDLEQTREGVRVRCETGDGLVDVAASYVVAAGGARGDVLRRAVGVTFDGRTFDDKFLICDIRASLPGWENERRFYFDPEWNPGRQVLIHPCPDSTFRIDWQVPSSFDLLVEQADGGLDRRIRQILGDQSYDIVWSSVYRFHARVVDRMRVGRVLLVGDCAHLVAPFGARGLNSGVADAENAAWKLAFVLHGWAGEDLLESYHDERHAAALENLAVTSATMRFLVPQSESEWHERRGLLDAAALDPAKHADVDSGRFAEPYWYVDSSLTTPNGVHGFAGRPPRGGTPAPAPGILLPDAPADVGDRPDVTRIRQLVRDGVLGLAADGVDVDGARSALAEATHAPTAVRSLADVDSAGALTRALDARPGELWIVRPDGHVAAVVDGTSTVEIRDAVRRMAGLTSATTVGVN